MSTAFQRFHSLRFLALSAGMVPLLAAPGAQAGHRSRNPAPSPWETAFRSNSIAVEVQVNGRSASLYRAASADGRRYFEARKGEEYALRVRNQTGRRMGVLVTTFMNHGLRGRRRCLQPR